LRPAHQPCSFGDSSLAAPFCGLPVWRLQEDARGDAQGRGHDGGQEAAEQAADVMEADRSRRREHGDRRKIEVAARIEIDPGGREMTGHQQERSERCDLPEAGAVDGAVSAARPIALILAAAVDASLRGPWLDAVEGRSAGRQRDGKRARSWSRRHLRSAGTCFAAQLPTTGLGRGCGTARSAICDGIRRRPWARGGRRPGAGIRSRYKRAVCCIGDVAGPRFGGDIGSGGAIQAPLSGNPHSRRRT
jgi:hypothetical protein